MIPTRQWTHHLSHLSSRAAKTRGQADPAGATRRLIDEVLGSFSELLEDFNRLQVECEQLQEDRRAEGIAHKQLFDHMPSACIVTDQHGRILHGNCAAGRLLNITNKRLDGRELLLYSHNRDAFLELLSSLPSDDRVISVSLIMRPRERRPVATTATLMAVNGPQRRLWLWFFQAERPQEARVEAVSDPAAAAALS